ncbi:hypothetical protein NQZ68_023823 [Dissostichus eleginoides]|nr:hypothetical protein NQZ68_023823 [Dissostichus eleginoides]
MITRRLRDKDLNRTVGIASISKKSLRPAPPPHSRAAVRLQRMGTSVRVATATRNTSEASPNKLPGNAFLAFCPHFDWQRERGDWGGLRRSAE